MNLAKYNWELPTHSQEETKIIEELQTAGLKYSPAFLHLCIERGFTSKEQIEQAINQKPQLYHDPFNLYQMDIAVERLQEAVANGEQILIYGDYDADGITSTLILFETLETIGANVDYYLPNRITDGYGPNVARYEEFIANGVQLILTCDNGIAGHEAIARAKELGVDVIVSDHHEMQATLPDAYAIIHPKHPEGDYPFAELSGAGVALKISHALLDEIMPEVVELAAIGTLCDMVSLTDENRTIVLGGLQFLKDTQRLGLRLLLETQQVEFDKIDVDTVGFVIGPRLNAIGRLGDPTPALKLLQTFDEEMAQQLVVLINEKNSERQAIVKQIQQEVEARIDLLPELPNVIVESGTDWHAGVLGIVASRLKEKYNRPTILFQHLLDKQELKGSGRSVDQVNIFEWLQSIDQHISYYGGHSQAAGLTVNENSWENFKEALHSLANKHEDKINQPESLKIDAVLPVSEIEVDFIEEVELLGPFGMDNPRPLFVFEDVLVKNIRLIGADKTHVKLSVSENQHADTILDCVAFSKATQFEGIQNEDTLSLVGTLSLNEWRNKVSPQVMVTDMGIARTQWLDYRSSRIAPELLQETAAIYVFRHSKLAAYFSERIPSSSQVMLYQEVNQESLETNTKEKLIIMEPPQDLDSLEFLIKQTEWSKIYLGSFVQESKYTAGEPTRQEFAVLYRWLSQQSSFHFRQSLSKMSEVLKIHQTRLKLMIVVFFEAEFVTIKDGFVSFNTAHSKEAVDLFALPAIEKYRREMQTEALLNYQTISEIERYFEENEVKS